MVRSVDAVRRDASAVDLAVTAVRYWPLDPLPGLLTTEGPLAQGLELRLPNAPFPAGGDSGDPWVETRAATLRLRVPDPLTVRLTLLARPEGRAGSDDILVRPPPESGRFELDVDDDSVSLRTGQVTLTLRRRPFGWALAGPGGGVVSRSGGDMRQVAGFPLAPALAFGDGMAWCSFELAPGEKIVGLGEQFGPVVHNGARLVLIADDALGAGAGRTYKAAPVFHSSAGYSGLVCGGGPVSADVGARYPSVLSFECEEEGLDLFVFAATTPKARLSAYTGLTGRAGVPPRWALGVWMSRCRYRDRYELLDAAAGMRTHGVPCDVMHLDPDWLERDLLSCDFVWSEAKFGDPSELVAGLAADGYHLSLWELPYLDPACPLHAEAERLGYLVRDASGALAAARVLARDGRPRALVDFSNPDARRWWKRLHDGLLDLGVAAFTTDFGEGLPDDAVMADGRSGRAWRNLYPLLYNRTVSEAVSEAGAGPGGHGAGPHANRQGLVWGRSGWAGSQRYPAQWGGDPESSVAGMAATLRAGLSWSLSAPGLWGHDIGGFYGAGPSPELYVRWAQWGCLSPMTRFHGLGPREPWAFGDRALAIVRDFARLRYRLLPYLTSAAGEAARFGWPVLRPVCLEYPDDAALWHLDTEYLLGSDLLVVPVLDESAGPVSVRCVLPPGCWLDWWSGSAHQGPGVVSVTVPLERLPLFVRAGAVIPMGPEATAHTGELPEGDWIMHCWPGSESGPATAGPGHATAEGTARASLGPSTLVYDGPHELRYSLEWAPGPGGEHEVVALRCDEPVPRSSGAALHLPGLPTRQLSLRRQRSLRTR